MNKRPQQKMHDWHSAKYGECGCGRWARLADGQCAECHDADYRCELEEFYLEETAEAVRECVDIAESYGDPIGGSIAKEITSSFPEYFKGDQ